MAKAKMPSMPAGRTKLSTSKLRRSESGGGSGMLAAILVAVSLMMFTLSVREGDEGFFATARAVTQTIVAPVRMIGSYAAAPFAGFSNVVRNLTSDEATLSELKAENARLTARNVELEEAEQTARRLEEILDLRNTYSLQSVAARVIAGSTSSWVSSVTIDKGSAAGVSVGMPVSNARGAVGQVIECGATTAAVRLLTDEGSSVAAMVQSSRAQGMLEGSANGTLRLTLIRTDQTVNVGDVVVTSGLGGVFPKGLPVGKVSSVEKSPGSTYYDIVVDPYFRPENLEEVLVITSLTDEQQATSEDIEAADAPDLEAASGRAVSAGGTDGDDDGDGTSDEADDDASGEADGTTDDVADSSSTGAATSEEGNDATATSAGSDDGSGYGLDDYSYDDYDSQY